MPTEPAALPFLFAPSSAAEMASGSAAAFAAAPPADSGDVTRREIGQILRELASASRSEISREDYVRMLTDRVLRSVVAHGVVLWWRRTGEPGYRVDHRLGIVTDHGWTADERATHDRMIAEVSRDGVPVVVPPTPGASSPDVPANPTFHPAALVPIVIDPSATAPEGWLEVFLEQGVDVATQRGSLRFLAQVADLAGEFFRSGQLRQQAAVLRCNDQIDNLATSLHGLTRTRSIEARWIDHIADSLPFARLALCRIDAGSPKLIAIAHVPTIDRYAHASGEIIDASSAVLTADRDWWIASLDVDSRGDAVVPRLTIAAGRSSNWRLVVCDRPDVELSIDELQRHCIRRSMVVGEQAWNAASRIESLPGGRWWATWTASEPANADLSLPKEVAPPARTSRTSRTFRIVASLLAVVCFACCPVPSVVPCRGIIRPAQSESHHAPMDASVTAVHVRHGQSVRAGEPLLTLDSRELHEKQTTLLGRRAVLSERRTQWKQTLVKTGSTESTLGALDGRQIEEEIASIDSQIAIVQEIQSSLTLRAGRDGTVDAWRLNEVTVGRPMRRGDPLVRVVGDGAGWIVDARVPQRRTPLVREALDAGDFVAEASPDGNAGLKMIAQFDRFGPITTDSIDGTPAITLRCVLDDSKIDARNLVGDMPARVTIRCGKIPLGRFLMEDLWMTTQTWWTMIR